VYKAGTILKLKKQRKPDTETRDAVKKQAATEKDVALKAALEAKAAETPVIEFPYNLVRVIGPSPISRHTKGDWIGADAAGVLLTGLTNFGATLDEPFGWLRTLYDVEEIPEEPQAVIVHKDQAAILAAAHAVPETPEDIFKAKAPGVPPKEGETRGRTPMSPLGEPVNSAAKSVLDD
jgi:hypothetical protein